MAWFRDKNAEIFGALFGRDAAPRARAQAPAVEATAELVANSPTTLDGSLPRILAEALIPAPVRLGYDDGQKFPGGWGPTEVNSPDYWTLRQRSAHLFHTNLYARGLVRRLVTNEINTGLHLEATPEEKILGLPEDALSEWTENVENRFSIWARDPFLCDHNETLTWGALQAMVRRESLIDGDVLVVLRQDQRTGLPRVQIVNGAAVQNPFPMPKRPGARIEHGVEISDLGRHIAYWIRQSDGTSKRIPAWGEKTGRRIAWLVYGTDKRLNDVRGRPLLSLVLQSLKEIDRYRDSVQRKALINALIAVFIKKGEDKPSARPLTGAFRRGVEVTATEAGAAPRMYNTVDHIPGLILDELQHGEEPVAFTSNGTDERFGGFEEAIIQGVAWAYEVPPEILRLAFSSNYSASQAAINEFKMYLNRVRTDFGQDFCQPIYAEWLLSETLSGKIDAPQYLEAWRDAKKYDVLGAWTSADWAGHIKPAVDLTKLVGGYAQMIELGLITRDRAARELTGTKFSKNVKRLALENPAIAEANKSTADIESRKKTRLAGSGGDEDPDAEPTDDEPIDAEDDDAPAKKAG